MLSPRPHGPLRGGLDCLLPEVNAGRRFPVPAPCARGLLANPEWHGRRLKAGERVRAAGPVPSRPAGTAGSQNKGPSVGSALALGMAGAEATPSEPGGLRQCWVLDTWALPARHPQGAPRALPGNGCPGPHPPPALASGPAFPQASPSLQGATTLRCPLPGPFEQPPFLEPQARAQGLASCRGTWALGPAPSPALGRGFAGVHGTSPPSPLPTTSPAHCPDNSLTPVPTLGTGATHLRPEGSRAQRPQGL